MPRHQIIDLTGQRFGRLLVIEKAGNQINGSVLWKCQCECGKFTRPSGQSLRNGKAKSCGCLSVAYHTSRLTTHGQRHTRLYRIWSGILKRCTNAKCKCFAQYGGRGITLCDEWRSFDGFARWASDNGYSDKLTIERRDNDAGYAPSNCTWIEKGQQTANRRNVRKNAKGLAYYQIANLNGLTKSAFHCRIRRGWPAEIAASAPPNARLNKQLTSD